jgi:hypothetical protein
MESTLYSYPPMLDRLCQMKDITDAEIQADAVREVTRAVDGTDPEPGVSEKILKHPVVSASRNKGVNAYDRFFQDHADTETSFYRLPMPVVNIHYLYGICPVLPKKVHRSLTELDDLVYYRKGLVTESKDEHYAVGSLVPLLHMNAAGNQLLSSEEADKVRSALQDGAITIRTGADAVLWLLEQAGVENTGIVHTVLPILPLRFRADAFSCATVGQTAWYPRSIEQSLEHVIRRSVVLIWMQENKAPDFLIDRQKLLVQEAADVYIDNGARPGHIALDGDGIPCDSLKEEYDRLNGKVFGFDRYVDWSSIDSDKVFELVQSLASEDDTFFYMPLEDIRQGRTQGGEDVSTLDSDYHRFETERDSLFAALYPAIRSFLSIQYPDHKDRFGAIKKEIGTALLETLSHDSEADRSKADYRDFFFLRLARQVASISAVLIQNGTAFAPVGGDETDVSIKRRA